MNVDVVVLVAVVIGVEVEVVDMGVSSSDMGEGESAGGGEVEEEAGGRGLEEEGREASTEDKRERKSLFSFLASESRFSRESMCILYSRLTEVSLVIFCSSSWFSDMSPFVLSSRSLMYSFLRCRERAADCLFFNNLQAMG